MHKCITPPHPINYSLHLNCSSSSHPHIQSDGLNDCDCGPPGLVGDQAHVLAVDVLAGHVELVGQLLVQATPPKLYS